MSPADILEPNKTFIFTYTAEAADLKNKHFDKPSEVADAMQPQSPPVLQFTATVVDLIERDPCYQTLRVKNFKYDNGEEIKSEIVTMPFS